MKFLHMLTVTFCVIYIANAIKFFIYHKPSTRCCTSGKKYIIYPETVLKFGKVESKSGALPTQSEPLETELIHPILKSSNNVANTREYNREDAKALLCSKMSCSASDLIDPVCACNHNTGNIVSFNNKCDMLKHNCRFNTDFKLILSQICPWELESRRANLGNEFDK